MVEITPQIVLKAYAAGVFPMSEGRDDPHLFWLDPEHRGILPLDRCHFPRRLLRTVRSGRFEVRVNSDFGAVIRACAGPGPGRWSTWINDQIIDLFSELNRKGYAHSVECWRGDSLAGGLYGVTLGRAFFGESMFSRESNASKVALVHLVARLRIAGFTLLDTQFVTDHLKQFGVREIAREDYHRRLEAAIGQPADFTLGGAVLSGDQVMQSITQTS